MYNERFFFIFDLLMFFLVFIVIIIVVRNIDLNVFFFEIMSMDN